MRLAWQARHEPGRLATVLRDCLSLADDCDCAMDMGALGLHSVFARAAAADFRFLASSSDAVLTEDQLEELQELGARALGACSAALPPGHPCPANPVPGVIARLAEIAHTAASDHAASAVEDSERSLAAELRSSGQVPSLPVPFRFRLMPPERGGPPDPTHPEADTTLPPLQDDDDASGAPLVDEDDGVEAVVEVLARPLRIRMSSHDDVGTRLWPAEPVIARWLLAHRASLLEGRRVLEIGAGLAVAGIAIARFAKQVTLSDFHVPILRHLRQSLRLNGIMAKSADSVTSPDVTVAHLDWSELLASGGATPVASDESDLPNAVSLGPFDTIFGADIAVSERDCLGVAAVLDACLARTSDARGVFLIAPPHVRFGSEFLAPVLRRAGYHVAQRDVGARYAHAASREESDLCIAGGYEPRLQLFIVARARSASSVTQ